MFEPTGSPRVFALPPGADFGARLVEGLTRRMEGRPPEALARATVYVNTTRMRRRVAAVFDEGPARLLPRIRLITELGRDPSVTDLPPPVPPLRRRLELARLVAGLIEADPRIAPRSAAFDLADSLAALLDEMQGEGVPLAAIEALDIGAFPAHWDRSRRFLALIGPWLEMAEGADPEARQRRAVETLAQRWRQDPPAEPVIVAGSTGSRGTTLAFMDAVARLPQGALVLPGFDADMPGAVWERLAREPAEDHPQYRFVRLLERLGIGPDAVRPWSDAPPPAPARNRLVSLALRPAPVTNQWLSDGPTLGPPGAATDGLTLIEAPGPRAEARAIAWLLREAAEAGRRAALVSPDRMLTRRVAAMLDRWNILPDDSAGKPLALTPPGRLLRQSAELLGGRATLDATLALLKHPLTHRGAARNEHLRHTRDLELWLRRTAVPWVDGAVLGRWAAKDAEDRGAWAGWLGAILEGAAVETALPLAELVTRHLDLAERLVEGAVSEDRSALWDKPAGRKAAAVAEGLRREACAGGAMTGADYASLFQAIIAREDVREPDAPHPGIMIWGTLEARVQGADLVILGGLNDGTWPDLPAPDPWLNRRMRQAAGLLLPERRIGLSAHDFQQAIAAPEAVLTRTLRDESAEPVPSRWLNRLTNLLEGLPDTGGGEALAAMRARGQRVLEMSARLDRPGPAETAPPTRRPSPRPPVAARPRKLSVTEIETLIRDPYAVYARHLLGLRALRPLRPAPDALLRGTVLHRIFARFMAGWQTGALPDLKKGLVEIAREEVGSAVAWPLAARLWEARIARIAAPFIAEETQHLDTHAFLKAEVEGALHFGLPDFTVHGRADRIDRTDDGGLAILDYKSGPLPSVPQMNRFSVQLLVEALIAEAGGFDGIAAAPVRHVVYVGLGGEVTRRTCALVDEGENRFATASVRADFERLIARYDLRGQGYTARRAVARVSFEGDFDHLSRYGEWDETSAAAPEDVG